MKLYVYPAFDKTSNKLLQTNSLDLDTHLSGLMNYLKSCNKICDIDNADTSKMNIFSDEVLKMIYEQKEGWEKMVPKAVADRIKEKELFEYEPPLKQPS